MPRPPRTEYAGAVYHITSRGNGRQNIFHTDDDRKRFLEQLQDSLKAYEVTLHAYVLMSNHYHLLVRTNQANLSRFLQRLNTSYALYYRYKHNKPGHLFQGRYHAKLVDGDEYLLRLTRYIHLNPIKIKAVQQQPKVKQVDILKQYPWSSYSGYVKNKSAVSWVDYRVLHNFGRGLKEDRRRYRAFIHAMILKDDDVIGEALKASTYAIGSDDFIREVEKSVLENRKNDDRDRDVQLPESRVSFEDIDTIVASIYGTKEANLKEHGHVAGEAKLVAMELAVRLTGQTMRAIGAHYGGLTSSAVSMVRRKIRNSEHELHARIDKIMKKITRA